MLQVTRAPLQKIQLVPNRGLQDAIAEKTQQLMGGGEVEAAAHRPPSPTVQPRVDHDAPVTLHTG